MPKKLTKDQKYNRKRRKDGNKDFRRVPKEGYFDGVRVTRKQITFYISNEASERLQQMADYVGVFKWEMASRIILKGLLAFNPLVMHVFVTQKRLIDMTGMFSTLNRL